VEELVIEGHAGWVTCVSHFPKSHALITGTRDRTLKIWDALTGEEKKAFTLVGEPPAALRISPDERLVAISSSQRSVPVKVLDLASGRFIGNLLAQDRITAVDFSPDGQTVVTVEDKGVVRVWDSEQFKVAATYKVPSHSAAAIAFDNQSRPEFLLAGMDRTVKKVLPGNAETRAFEKGHREAIGALQSSPDGGTVVTAGRDKQVIVWDADSGKIVSILHAHQEQVSELALNPVRRMAASYDPKAGIKVWDLDTAAVFRTFPTGDSEINCMAFTPDGERLMAGGKDMTLRIWQVNGRQIFPTLALAKVRPAKKQMKSDRKFKVMVDAAAKAIRRGSYATAYSMLQDSRQLPGYERSDVALELLIRMKDHGTRTGLKGGWNRKTVDTSSGVMDCLFSPSGINFLTAQADHTIRLWSTKTGDCLKILRGHTNLVASVCFSVSGREVASGSDDRSVRIWDLITGKNLAVLKGHLDSVSSVAYSPDGTSLLSGSWDGALKLWRNPEGNLLKTLKSPDDKIASARFVGSADRIVSAGFEGALKLWDVASGRTLRELKGHKDKVTSLDVSPGCELLLTGSMDGTARVWDARTGSAIRTLEVDAAGVRTVAFSPDQIFLLTGGNDGVLRIWNVERGKLLREFRGHSREITSAGFSPNQRFAISSSADGMVMIWELDWEWRFDEKTTQGPPG
jgi:WD40 repeat protein